MQDAYEASCRCASQSVASVNSTAYWTRSCAHDHHDMKVMEVVSNSALINKHVMAACFAHLLDLMRNFDTAMIQTTAMINIQKPCLVMRRASVLFADRVKSITDV